MSEWLIRGDDGEPDLGVSDADARVTLLGTGSDTELTGGPGAYSLRAADVVLEITDEPGFGWQVAQASGSREAASQLLDLIAANVSARLRRPVRVVDLG